jgi:ParB-like chromosome segregation protein Spo0J
MTTIAPVPGPEAEVPQLIKIAAIKIADRLRPIDGDRVQLIANDMLRHGLLTPIDVCREGAGYRLVDGAHRLAAMQALDWHEAPAFVRDHATTARRGREVSANLMRHELGALDRAAHVVELTRLEMERRGLDPDASLKTLGGLARENRAIKSDACEASATVADAYCLQDGMAERVGLSARTIRRDLQIQRQLTQEARALISGTPTAASTTELLQLARLVPAEQLQAATALSEGRVKSVGAFVRTAPTTDTPVGIAIKKAKAFAAAFRRLSPDEQRRALSALAQEKLPRGYKVIVPGGGRG